MKPSFDSLNEVAQLWLPTLCVVIPDRSVGNPGNRSATDYFAETDFSPGWRTNLLEVTAIDWADGGAELSVGNTILQVQTSPYSLGGEVEAESIECSTLSRLKQIEIDNNARKAFAVFDQMEKGVQRVQGDQSIFIQFGRPAIPCSSSGLTDNITDQNISPIPNDNIHIVTPHRMVEIAPTLKDSLSK